ncbi:MAG: acetyl-CoA carboxylase biotin carboxyl carrier protein [Kiloniellales bacterium]
MTKFEPDEELVRRLSSLLAETGLSEIEYEANGQRIRVARHLGGAANMAGPIAPAASGPSIVPAAVPTVESVPENAIVSPMVGTAYVASEPGGKPFVSVGDKVREGQTVLIIEAMKVMNPIPAPRAGRIARIMVQDGQPVEFGEPLMIVE